MRSKKEIENKKLELTSKTFEILETSMRTANPFNKPSLKTIRYVMDTLDYVLGNKDELEILKGVSKNGKE